MYFQFRFSRTTASFDSTNDFNLDDSLYIIRGYRNDSEFTVYTDVTCLILSQFFEKH